MENDREYCAMCGKMQPTRSEPLVDQVMLLCAVCGAWLDTIWKEDDSEEDDDGSA
jgi:hypothetical protein